MKTQICIIDDEQDGRDYISLLLENEFPELQIAFQGSSVEEAYIYLAKNSPDILFLDIQLTDGNAFDLLSRLKEIQTEIIFITAYENFAIQAIKNKTTDYLLKPIKKMDFIIAVNKALENIKKKKPISHYHTTQNKITLPTLYGFRLVEIDLIIRCEADANYTLVYLLDKSKIFISKNLKELEDQLCHHDFMRIHHKHLINMKYLKEYIKGKGGQTIMTDNTAIEFP